MNNIKKVVLSMTVLLLFSILLSTKVNASSVETPFAVNPILSESQDEGINNYFSITVDDEFEQTLGLIVKNESNEERSVEVTPVNAYTSPNGVIQYKKSESENSTILDRKHEFTKYSSKGGIYELKPGEEKEISIDVKVDDYEGILMGGILINPIDESDGTGEIEEGFSIDTKVNFVVAAVLTFNDVETSNESLKFDKPYVDPMPSYYAIRLPTSHLDPKAKSFHIEYEVSHNGDVLFTSARDFVFAPMTKTDIPFPWENDKITKGGEYDLIGFFEYEKEDGSVEKINFEESFKYDDASYKPSGGSKLVTPMENMKYSYWLLLLIPVVGLIILLLKQRRYVLFSNNEPKKVIYKDDELYSHIQKGILSKDENDSIYKHIYKKDLSKESKSHYYKFIKTINLKK